MYRWVTLSLLFHLFTGAFLIFLAPSMKQIRPVMIDLSMEPSLLSETSTGQKSSPKGLPVKNSAPAPAPVAAKTAPEASAKIRPEQILAPQQSSVTAPVHNSNTGISGQQPSSAGESSGSRAAVSSGKQAGGTAQAGTEGAVSAETAKNRYQREHFNYIRDLILKHLIYPPVARRMHWSGKVTISFTIGENGDASNIRVLDSSGHQLLDQSAVETVKKAAPFPKPPVPAQITMPVNYKLL